MKKILASFLLILAMASTGLARNPVLFVHGLTSEANTFRFIANYLKSQGWTYGGELALNTVGAVEQPPAGELSYRDQIVPSLRKADFYLMNFSDYRGGYPSQNLSFEQQGRELQTIVKKILDLTGESKIILVGHSMGGLAVRSYLQLFKAENVEHAVFVATPHQGSELANADSKVLEVFYNLAKSRNLSRNSMAVKSMAPSGPAILELNSFSKNPISPDTKLTTIIVEDTSSFEGLFAKNIPNDQVVAVSSADLTQVPGAQTLIPQKITKLSFAENSTVKFGIPLDFAHWMILEDERFITMLPQIIDSGSQKPVNINSEFVVEKQPVRTSAAPTPKPVTTGLSPSDEAFQIASGYWMKKFTFCSGSWYTLDEWAKLVFKENRSNRSAVKEVKDLTITLTPRNLTEADRLNGIEWEGRTRPKATSTRQYENGKWSQWYSNYVGRQSEQWTLTKINGQWSLGSFKVFFATINEPVPYLKPIACTDIPR